MPVFFIPASDIQNGTVTIAGQLARHLRASLRTRIGETLWLGTENRQRFLVRITQVDRRHLTGQVLEHQAGPTSASPRVILGQALLKGEKMDWLIQKATELGTASLIPLLTERGIARPPASRIPTQQQRWQQIALEAAQQSERWDLLEVLPAREATEFFTEPPAHSLRIILCERRAGHSLSSLPLPSDPESVVSLAIGPEGGWTSEEVRVALEHGFVPVSLGGRILRAETAALTSVSILQSRFGELG